MLFPRRCYLELAPVGKSRDGEKIFTRHTRATLEQLAREGKSVIAIGYNLKRWHFCFPIFTSTVWKMTDRVVEELGLKWYITAATVDEMRRKYSNGPFQGTVGNLTMTFAPFGRKRRESAAESPEFFVQLSGAMRHVFRGEEIKVLATMADRVEPIMRQFHLL